MKQVASLLYGCLALAGLVCAPAINTPVLAGGTYDGNYHGTLTGGGQNAPSCAKHAPVQMTVVDSRLTHVHMGNATINATVAADGSFSGSSQNKYTTGRTGVLVQTLDGKITGDQIEAESKVGN